MITRDMLSVGCRGTVGTQSIKGLGFRVQGLGNDWGSVGLDGVWLVWQVLLVTTCIECKQDLRLALIMMSLLLTSFASWRIWMIWIWLRLSNDCHFLLVVLTPRGGCGRGDAKGWWHATLTDDIGDVPCTDICAFLVLSFGTLCVECDAMLKWLQRLHCCCC